MAVRDLKDLFMILSNFSFIFLLRNFIYDMSPSAEKEIKITPYGGGIEAGNTLPKSSARLQFVIFGSRAAEITFPDFD